MNWEIGIMLAPVVVFAYNRENKLKQCLNSLLKCECADKTEVIVFSDGFKGEKDRNNVENVRRFLRELKSDNNFKSLEIVEQPCNKGLANSIITGVTDVIRKYGRVIVAEDDLLFSEDFLIYMNGALDYYDEYKEYGCISSYTMPLKILEKYPEDVYAARKGDCWGWATWADRWDKVDWDLKDFDEYLCNRKARKEFSHLELGLEEQLIAQHNGKLDAWAARWLFYLFRNNLLTIYPRVCRTINIGFDTEGTNCSNTTKYDNYLYDGMVECEFNRVCQDDSIEKAIYHFGGNIIMYKLRGVIWKIVKKLK